MKKTALILLVLGLFYFLISYNMRSDTSYWDFEIKDYKLNW